MATFPMQVAEALVAATCDVPLDRYGQAVDHATDEALVLLTERYGHDFGVWSEAVHQFVCALAVCTRDGGRDAAVGSADPQLTARLTLAD